MCNFDGGDCCMIDQIGDGYCDALNSNRMCRDDEGDSPCQYNLIGNGQCDLMNNKYNCDFDGGECCRKHWIADGFCDNINNNVKCNYDGGDCCLFKGGSGDNFCQHSLNIQQCGYDGGDCCEPELYGDGRCDLYINDNPICGYDGGDCCEGNIDTIGDSVCEDENNNARCSFDGGDCCMANLDKTSCSECKCKSEDDVVNPHLVCQNYSTIGDGICHDENNNVICQYDAGDCCLPNVNMTACIKCQCIQEIDFDPCPGHDLIADGQCNKINDNLICSYDGDDCLRYAKTIHK